MYQGLCLEFETAGAVCSIEESSRVPICGFPAAITSDSKNGDTLPTAYSRKCVTVFLNQTISLTDHRICLSSVSLRC